MPKVKDLDLPAIMAYLNSERVQHYVAQLYRDFVPHLTASMLKRVPIGHSVAQFSSDGAQLLLIEEDSINDRF